MVKTSVRKSMILRANRVMCLPKRARDANGLP